MSVSGNRGGPMVRPTAPLNETTRLTGRNVLTILLSLGLLAAAILVQEAKQPDVSNAFAPSVKLQGELGTPVHLRQGDVTLSNVRAARTLQAVGGLSEEKVTTAGIWLVLDFAFEPVRERESLGITLYTRDHNEYPATGRVDSTEDTLSGPPGFTTKGVVAFELPPGKIAGSTVVVGSGGLYGVPLWDTQAVITLGIDEEQETRLIHEAPATLKIEESS